MIESRSIWGRLIGPLWVVTVVELLTYQTAAPMLRPDDDTVPGFGHSLLETVGLFTFHFATFLGAIVLVSLSGSRRATGGRNAALMFLGGAVSLLTLYAHIWSPPPSAIELALQVAFGGVVIVACATSLRARTYISVRIAVVLFSLPLVVHVWTPLAVQWYGPESLFDGLPDTAVRAGHWLMIVAAITSPYLLTSRPTLTALKRPVPYIVALIVGASSTALLIIETKSAAQFASLALGIELGPGVSFHYLSLGILALATVVWTLIGCITANSATRRRIGYGIGFLLIAGYGFRWPVQYLLGAIGIVLMSWEIERLPAEESRPLQSPDIESSG